MRLASLVSRRHPGALVGLRRVGPERSCSVASTRWPPTSAWTGPTPSTRPSCAGSSRKSAKPAGRDRMLTIRALTRTDVRTA